MTNAIKRSIRSTRSWLDQNPDIPEEIAAKLLDKKYPAVEAYATAPIATFRGKIYEMFSRLGTPEQFENLLNDANRPIILFQVIVDSTRLPTSPNKQLLLYKVRFADIIIS